MAMKTGLCRLAIHSNSQLGVGQVTGELDCEDPTLTKYLNLVHKLQKQFETLQNSKMPWGDNARVDKLFKRRLRSATKTLATPSINTIHTTTTINGHDCRIPLLQYLKIDKITGTPMEHKRIRTIVARHVLSDNTLLRRGYSKPL